MKKILFITILLHTLLNANSTYEVKLYETVIPSIFIKYPINVYLDKNTQDLLKNSTKFKVLYHCDESVQLLIGENFDNLPEVCKDKPVFSTTYRSFKNNKNSFGAFYWRKGRPQIKFKTNILNKYKLILPNALKKYEK